MTTTAATRHDNAEGHHTDVAPGSSVLPRTGRTWPLRVCLGLNLLGAGVAGAVLLVDPSLAPDIAGAGAAPEVARLIGSIWFAVGVLSLIGLARPWDMRGLLGVQVVYKAIYVAAVGIPAVAAGTASPTTTGLTAGFAAMVVVWSVALLATRGGPGGHR